MDKDDVRSALLSACLKARGASVWAKQNGLSPQYVSDVVGGRRDPGKAILTALGFRKIVTYEKIIEGEEERDCEE